MRLLSLLLVIIFIAGCNKPKAVLICGDHVCVNKAEAKQYFEENLTIEVRIKDKKEKENLDLVELNLRENSSGKKEVIISSIKKTNKNLKILSEDEINNIKDKIKYKNKQKKITKKISNSQKEKKPKKKKENKDYLEKDVIDVCTVLDKCNIDEISKYLIKQGIKKEFPDITQK